MSDSSSRSFPARPVVGVGAVVIDPEGQVVLVRRGHAPLSGTWSLPGGVLELGESLASAIVREVLEETGLQVRAGPVVEVFEHVSHAPDGRCAFHYVIIDYVCEVTGGTLRAGSDAADVALASPDRLASFDLTEQVTAVIARAMQMAGRGRPPGQP